MERCDSPWIGYSKLMDIEDEQEDEQETQRMSKSRWAIGSA